MGMQGSYSLGVRCPSCSGCHQLKLKHNNSETLQSNSDSILLNISVWVPCIKCDILEEENQAFNFRIACSYTPFPRPFTVKKPL